MTTDKTPTNAERLAAIEAELAQERDAAAAKRAQEEKAADAAAKQRAAAAEKAARPQEPSHKEALLAEKASLEAAIQQAAIFAAHESAESVKDAVFANAAASAAAATFGGNPDYCAVAAQQLGDALGVTLDPLVFSLSSDAGVVNATLWGLTFSGQVRRDEMADVWTASIRGTTYMPDGVTVRHIGDVGSPLQLALLLAGSPVS